ncbi:hypothetical protein N2152v2_002623 [Parachlorella kessleri]
MSCKPSEEHALSEEGDVSLARPAELAGHLVASSCSDTTAQPCNREPPPTDQPGNTAATQPPNAGLCRSSITSGRSVCIAVGSDVCTEKVLKYAAKYICKPQDSVTLVHITKGPRPRPEDGQILEHAKAILLRCACEKVKPESVCLEAVPAGKHVGQSLVAHCLDAKYHILVTGNRGLSGMKTKLLSLVGEGSVSRYCAEHLPRNVAVVVVRPPEGHQWCK